MINLKEKIKATKIKKFHYKQQKFTDNEKRILQLVKVSPLDVAKIEFGELKTTRKMGVDYTREKLIYSDELLEGMEEKNKVIIYMKEENEEIIKFILVINDFKLIENQLQLETIIYKKEKY